MSQNSSKDRRNLSVVRSGLLLGRTAERRVRDGAPGSWEMVSCVSVLKPWRSTALRQQHRYCGTHQCTMLTGPEAHQIPLAPPGAFQNSSRHNAALEMNGRIQESLIHVECYHSQWMLSELVTGRIYQGLSQLKGLQLKGLQFAALRRCRWIHWVDESISLFPFFFFFLSSFLSLFWIFVKNKNLTSFCSFWKSSREAFNEIVVLFFSLWRASGFSHELCGVW